MDLAKIVPLHSVVLDNKQSRPRQCLAIGKLHFLRVCRACKDLYQAQVRA